MLNIKYWTNLREREKTKVTYVIEKIDRYIDNQSTAYYHLEPLKEKQPGWSQDDWTDKLED